ncbi:MAG TPA: phosphotransferase family protein [Steroidobacteraceae bacterium]|jgi:aminoglycoside phosphotransferase (APT) family kinase protein
MSNGVENLGRRMVELSRNARLGNITLPEWSARLGALIQAQPDVVGEVSVSSVRPVTSGAGTSSGTLLFEVQYGTDGSPVTRNCVLRFEPIRPLFHVYDMRAQVRIQQALADSAIPVPAQYWDDLEGCYLKVSGYVMERIDGKTPPQAWMKEGVLAEASPAERRQMILSFIRKLAALHKVDWRAKSLGFLQNRGQGDKVIDREVNWYWDALRWLGAHEPLNRFAPIRDWLIANEPPVPSPCLCHGDANLTNNLFRDGEVVAVIDWEMAFIGAPECDIGMVDLTLTSMTAELPDGFPSLEEIHREYEEQSGHTLRHMDYYTLFALFRGSTILTIARPHFPQEFLPTFDAHTNAVVSRMEKLASKLGAL